jgi:hypothetical protein
MHTAVFYVHFKRVRHKVYTADPLLLCLQCSTTVHVCHECHWIVRIVSPTSTHTAAFCVYYKSIRHIVYTADPAIPPLLCLQCSPVFHVCHECHWIVQIVVQLYAHCCLLCALQQSTTYGVYRWPPTPLPTMLYRLPCIPWMSLDSKDR